MSSKTRFLLLVNVATLISLMILAPRGELTARQEFILVIVSFLLMNVVALAGLRLRRK